MSVRVGIRDRDDCQLDIRLTGPDARAVGYQTGESEFMAVGYQAGGAETMMISK